MDEGAYGAVAVGTGHDEEGGKLARVANQQLMRIEVSAAAT